MVTGDRLTLTINGGAPWGFRLQGGGHYPLEVAKIRKNSHAAAGGMQEGDVVLTINGHSTSGRSHQSAMELVDVSSGTLTIGVARSGHGPSANPESQHQGRIIPLIDGAENGGPGLVTSAQADFSSTAGNTRTDVHTEEFVMRTDDGRRVTKTVTEQRVTRLPLANGVSPSVSHNSLASTDIMSRSMENRSPQCWRPPSQEPREYESATQSPSMWRPPSQLSMERRSSHEQSPIGYSQTLPRKLPSSNLQKSTSLLDIHFGHKGKTPSRSLSPLNRKPIKPKKSKENEDPIMACEQAKWEKIHAHDIPANKLSAMEAQKMGPKQYMQPKMNDPDYPMFEVPKALWSPPKIVEPPGSSSSQSSPAQKKWATPVPPKPLTPTPSPIPFNPDERPAAGMEKHFPGMIRPPLQPNVKPAPTPPPMPPIPLDTQQTFNVVSVDKLHRPDHLPVFGPPVMFQPGEEENGMMSPGYDTMSDISFSKRKIFSDSAFYDDATNRYPTIGEQMSMCKKIAQSLTSFANQRARGARMFAKRKRKADKWIHDFPRGRFGGSEYSSSVGDIADIDELDSELYHVEGGGKPLFSFRIPRISTQVSEGQKMSMSKAEFERLRLAAPKVDHHAVSPNQCFTIAADLQKGGKNRGAKLFAKRQQRVEKFVIDETNVVRSPVSPSTKLDYIVQRPTIPIQKTPWNAAATGDMNRAFNHAPQQSHLPPKPIPRHNLTADNQPKVMDGKNFNTKARGWGGAGPGVVQQSFYRDSQPSTDGSLQSRPELFDPDDPPKMLDQYGNYNNKIRAWPEPQPDEEVTMEFGDYNRRMKAWQDQGPHKPDDKPEFKDYNRKPKAFSPESPSLPERVPMPPSGDYNRPMKGWSGASLPGNTSVSMATNKYSSLPRGFHLGQKFKKELTVKEV